MRLRLPHPLLKRYARLAALTALVAPPTAPQSCATSRDTSNGSVKPQAVKQVVIDAARAEGELALLAASEPALAAAGRRRMDVLVRREDEMTGWVLPLLQSYLPRGAALPMRVYLGVKLPEPISAHDNAVFVDVASPIFGDADEALWNNIIRALYRQALTQALSPSEVLKNGDFTGHLLSRLQLEGLVAYVASQGRPDQATPEAYAALDSRAAATTRFMQLDDAFLAVKNGAKVKDIAAALDAVDAKDSLYGVVGGSMALAIERNSGRDALVETIAKGPAAFYDAYQRTGPGALVNFRVPGSKPTPTGELDLPGGATY